MPGLLPAIIQGLLLFIILTKHEYTKEFISLWAIIFLTISSAMQLTGKLLKDLAKSSDIDYYNYLENCSLFFIGIIIISFAKNTISIKKNA